MDDTVGLFEGGGVLPVTYEGALKGGKDGRGKAVE